MEISTDFNLSSRLYLDRLHGCFTHSVLEQIEKLALSLEDCWINKRRVFICGNGGSAANALHLANDLHYGVGMNRQGENQAGLRVEALTSNIGVFSCLANDVGYEEVFAHQLFVKSDKDDLVIVLSGSGNSENVVRALEYGQDNNLNTFAILGYDGGKCLQISKNSVHFEVCDMQIAEDAQLLVGHLCMKWLNKRMRSRVYGECL